MLHKKNFFLAFILIISAFHCFAGANFTITPLNSSTRYVNKGGISILAFVVQNNTRKDLTNYAVSTLPTNVKQIYTSTNHTDKICSNPFSLPAHNGRCLLLFEVTGATNFVDFSVCKGSSCTRASASVLIRSTGNDPTFPYGVDPTGALKTLNPYGSVTLYDSSDQSGYYATPESMLGSWAMIQALTLDISLEGQNFPSDFTVADQAGTGGNTSYAVGTAAVGDYYGLLPAYSGSSTTCDGNGGNYCTCGCDALNGQCFAIEFLNSDGSSQRKYMIFQSLNTNANRNSFDVYMAGGGSGAFNSYCQTFWGTGATVDFSQNIQNSDCDTYFNNFSTINTDYSVTYSGTTYPAYNTLQNACSFATNNGLNQQNFENIKMLAITCPTYLTQVTGINSDQTVVGQSAGGQIPVAALEDLGIDSDGHITNNGTTTNVFTISGSTAEPATTQMQDCKTPTAGFANHFPNQDTTTVPVYYQTAFSSSCAGNYTNCGISTISTTPGLYPCNNTSDSPYVIMPGNTPEVCSQPQG